MKKLTPKQVKRGKALIAKIRQGREMTKYNPGLGYWKKAAKEISGKLSPDEEAQFKRMAGCDPGVVHPKKKRLVKGKDWDAWAWKRSNGKLHNETYSTVCAVPPTGNGKWVKVKLLEV